MSNEELQYTIVQTQKAIKSELHNVVEYVAALQNAVNSDNWQDVKFSSWTDGYVARDVSKVSALLSRQSALIEALYIIESATESEVK